MVFRPRFPIWLAFLGLFGVAWSGVAEAPSPRGEMAAATSWLDHLDWPDLHGKPYTEFVLGSWNKEEKDESRIKVYGFLLGEDAHAYIILGDSGPLAKTRVQKWPDGNGHGVPTKKHPADLAKAVEKTIAELRQAKDQETQFEPETGMEMMPIRAFFLARCCARQGRADLAEKIDAGLESRWREHPLREGEKNVSPRDAMERALGDALFGEALEEFTYPEVTRAELLARFEQLVRDFPASRNREAATRYATTLHSMLAEDEAHAKTAKPLAEMKAEEKVQELVFQLRDQRNLPSSNSLAPRLVSAGMSDLEGPAGKLVAMGHAAVPALMAALGDTRLSRSYQPMTVLPGPGPALLTVGDCADSILSQIAGRTFWRAGPSYSLQESGSLKEAQSAAQQWWSDVQTKGEKALLIEGVRAANNDSLEQADRLIKMDPDAAVSALADGVHSTKSRVFRAWLIEKMGTIKTEVATQALRHELKDCPGLGGRVAAAEALRLRGEKGVVAAMIREWNHWSSPTEEKPITFFDEEDGLIRFLGNCQEVAGMQALLRRFPEVSTETKFKIINSAAGVQAEQQRKKWPVEVQALGEQLIVRALDDRNRRFGMGRSQGSQMCEDPRVCDMAALALTERWPKRYAFPWTITQFDRDSQIARLRDTWRTAHGLEALGAPPSIPDATDYNAVITNTTRGQQAFKRSIALSKPLTAEAIAETLHALGGELPKDCLGFTFCAERPKDRRGILVEIEWRHGQRPGEDSQNDFCTNILLGDKSLYNSAGGTSPTIDISEEMHKAMANALADRTGQPISITYAYKIERTPKIEDP